MSWNLKKRGKVYHVDLNYQGLRKRASLGVSSKKLATMIAGSLYEEWVKEINGIVGDVTLGDALENFLEYSKKSKKSFASDESREKNIFQFFDRNVLIADIKKSDLLDFMYFLKHEKNHSKKTVNNHLALLKAAINLMISDNKYEGKNPVKMVKIRKIQSKAQKFSVDQMKGILDFARELQLKARSKSQYYFYPFVYIALYSGMRSGEVMNLKWTDITENRIRINDPKSQQDVEIIPNNPMLRDFFMQLPRESIWIIGTDRRNSDTFRKIVLKMRKELDLPPGTTIHWLRHSFASYLSSQGVSHGVVQNILRHKNPTTTDIYLHTDFEEMSKAMEKIGHLNVTNPSQSKKDE